MSAIKHTDLFDFPAYEAGIKEVKKETAEFGKLADGVITRIAQQQAVLNKELASYAQLMRNFGVTTQGAGSALKSYNTQVDATVSNLSELKALQNGLAQVVDTQRASVNQLEAEYKALRKQLKDLNPAQADYAEQTERINSRIKQLIPGINAYNTALRNTRESVKQAEGSYKAMQAELTRLRDRLRSLPGAFDEFTGKLNRSNKEAVALDARIRQLDGSLKKADAQMGIYARNVGNYSSAFKGLVGAIGATLGVASVFEIGKAIFDVNRQFEGLNNAIRLVSGTSEEFAINQALLTRIANDYGLEIVGLTQAFKNFFAASTQAGIGADETRRIFDQVSKVAANLKLSQEEVNGVFTAFGQIASKGKVQAEELRGQIGERVPGAFAIAAKAIGVSQQELNKLLETGQVLADDFLPKFAAELEKTFGKEDKIESLNASVNRLFNSFRTGVQSENLTAFLTKVIDLTAQGVQGLFELLDVITNIDNITATFGNPLNFFSLDPNSTRKNIEEQVRAQVRLASAAARKELAAERERTQKRIESIDKDFREKDKAEQFKQLQFQKALAQERVRLLNAEKDPKRRRSLLSEAKFEQQVLEKLVKSYEQLNAAKTGMPKATGSSASTGPKGPSADDLLAKRVKNEQDLLKKLADLEVAQQELLLAQKLITEGEFQQEKLGIITDFLNRSIALEQSKGGNADAERIADLQRQIIGAQTEFTKFQARQEEERVKAAQRVAGEILKNEAETRRKQGEGLRELNEQRFQAEIDAENKAFALASNARDTDFKEEVQHLERIAEIKKRYAKDTGEEEIAIAQLYAERRRQIEQLAQQVVFDGLTASVQIVQDQFNAASDERLARLDQERERELAAAGNNAAAREAIEQRFNRRVAQEKRKQAQADKIFSLFNIALNTAQGVTRTIAQFGMPAALPLLPLVIAQGAIQAAVVAARPIPQFKKGTKSAPKGLAIVGEEGPEIIERNGRMFITPGKASFVKLTGGEKIHTAKETEKILERAEKNTVIQRIVAGDSAAVGMAMKSQAQAEATRMRTLAEGVRINQGALEAAFERSVRHIPVSTTIWDERGIRIREEQKNARVTYVNSKKLGR